MKTKLLIIAIFAVLAAGCLYRVYQGGVSPETSGVLANLGTGFIGTALTVLIVDLLYERRENARLLPKRVVVHEDVRLLIARTVTFWFNMYMAAVPGDLPKTIAELVQPESIKRILNHLDMNAEANVTPRRTWWQFLPEQLLDLRTLAEKILHRHSEILDPDAYRLVNQLVHNAMEPSLSSAIHASDIEMGYPRPQVLGSYLFVLDDYFPSLLKLVRWCNIEGNAIKRKTGNDVMMVNENLIGNRPEGTPRCMIAPENLARQLEQEAAFHRDRATMPTQQG